MTVEERWKEFVNELGSRVEAYDPTCAMSLREHLLSSVPPDEESLEWGVASTAFNCCGSELAIVLHKQGREREALLVLDTLRELNTMLIMLSLGAIVPQEFVTEIKLTRPI